MLSGTGIPDALQPHPFLMSQEYLRQVPLRLFQLETARMGR